MKSVEEWKEFQQNVGNKATEYFAKGGQDTLTGFLEWLDVHPDLRGRLWGETESTSESTVPYWYESGS